MPWNVVNKLENICISLNKEKIKTISQNDLERRIIENMGVTRETTIKRYIDVLIKLNWIDKGKKQENDEFIFNVTYFKEKGELF